jgi:hypothetical protein
LLYRLLLIFVLRSLLFRLQLLLLSLLLELLSVLLIVFLILIHNLFFSGRAGLPENDK